MINSISRRMFLRCLFVVSSVMLVEHAAYGMKRKFEKVEEDNDKQNDDKNKRNKTDESVKEETREYEEKQVAYQMHMRQHEEEKKKKFLEEIRNVFLVQGDTTKAVLILEKYPKILTLEFGEDKKTLLMAVANQGQKEIAQLLLEKGADVNKTDKDGMTALMFAAKKGNFEMVELLIEKGADIEILAGRNDAENSDNNEWNGPRTALLWAVENGHVEIVKLLLKNGAKIDDLYYREAYFGPFSILTLACESGHLEVVKKLVEYGAQINEPSVGGYTPLMGATEFKRKDIVKYLIEQGVNVNGCGDGEINLTALMIAAHNNDQDCIKLLLAAGADINAITDDGESALWYAWSRTSRDIKTIELFCKNKKLNFNLPIHKNVLDSAVENNDREMVSVLVKYGFNVNCTVDDSMTILMHASLKGHSEIVHFLLKNKAPWRITTEKVADVMWNGGRRNLILPKGSDALHFAVIENQKDIVKMLLRFFRSGKKIKNGLNQTGETPYELAVSQGYTEIVNLMDDPKSHLPVSQEEVEEHNILVLKGADFIDEVDDRVNEGKKKLINHMAHVPSKYNDSDCFNLNFIYLNN